MICVRRWLMRSLKASRAISIHCISINFILMDERVYD